MNPVVWLRLFGGLALWCVAAPPAAALPEAAASADAFVDSMAIGIKPPSWGNYTFVYANTALIKSRLGELGMRHVRTGAKDVTGDWDFGRELHTRLGIRSDVVISWNYVDMGNRLRANATWIACVEGANETNSPTQTSWTYKGQGFPAGTIALQNDIHALLRAAPTTAGIPLITPSVYFEPVAPETLLAGCPGDFENMHSYPAGGKPTKLLDTHIDHANQLFEPDRPIIATETGYHTALQAVGAVTEKAQGKYLPRLFADYWNRRIVRTYIYDLIDLGTDQTDPEATYGILRNDGTPKPAFTALRNLIALLKEPGASFTPGSLGYTLSGNLTNLRRLLLQKSNGDYYLLLWQDLSVFDGGNRTDITNPDLAITCSLATPIATGTIHRFDNLGNLVSSPAAFSGNTLSLGVPDSMLILKLTPRFRASAGDGKVVLEWQASSGNSGYDILRSVGTPGPYAKLAGGLTGTTYTDGTVENGTTYHYLLAPTGSTEPGIPASAATPRAVDLVVDTSDARGALVVGNWTAGSGLDGYLGADYRYAFASAGATASVKFTPDLPVPGIYDVYARWTAHSNRTTAAPFLITHASGSETVAMNQQLNNGAWVHLGGFPFAAGIADSVTLGSDTTANGYVVADAVRFVLRRRTAAAISASDVTATYDETPKPVPTATVPPGLDVVVTYNGTATPPVGPGVYVVNTSINDPFYSGTATSLLTITVPDVAAYALGARASRIVQAGDTWDLVFDRLYSEPTYTVQLSTDLVTWTDFSINPGAPGQEVRLPLPGLEHDQTRMFARLRVTLPGTP